MKLILIFMSTTKKIRVDQNGREYILFRIDVYFSEYILAVEIDEKKDAGRELVFESTRKKLGCKFIKINASKKDGAEYKIVRIHLSVR